MNLKYILTSATIAILFALFIGYGVEVFHDAPERAEYCGRSVYEMQTKESCIEAGGEWDERSPKPVDGIAEGFCRESKRCFEEFDIAREGHDRIVFIVALLVGISGLIGSIFLPQKIISNGLSVGSVLLILYGTLRYWQHAQDVLKFVLLGAALVVLLWFTYKKIDRK